METLKVATLNIWNRNGPWEARLVAIRETLQRLRPDVIGLQEVLRSPDGVEPFRQADLIAEGLGYETAFGGSWEVAGFELGNAVLSRFPIKRSEARALPSAGSEDHYSMLYAELSAPFAQLPFFVTHLNWKLDEGHVRQEQVRAIAACVLSTTPSGGFPAIVVGDFNAEPESDEIRFLRGHCALGGASVYFADAFAVAGNGSRGATFVRRNPFAADVREPDRRIDYVFVRPPDPAGRGEVLDAGLCFDEPVAGVFPSDHFGVTATIRCG